MGAGKGGRGAVEAIKVEGATMAKVVIKTQSGQYVGGGPDTELVDRVTRAHLYEDTVSVDEQIAVVNTTYGWNWQKADAETEYDKWINNQGE
jgi:hypothetical protein